MDSSLYIFSALVFILTSLICFTILKKALSLGLIDKPNERSSHKTPTPRGAGIAFCISVTSIMLISAPNLFQSIFGLYLIVPVTMAFLGFYDDFKNLSAKFKFFIQLLSCSLFSFTLFLMQPESTVSTITLHIFFVPYIMWFTNLFNFMDGVDGIAGSQGLISSLGFALLLATAPMAFQFSLFIAIGCFSFLLFNWHPAKVFMGDVGSCFLGSSLAVLSIYLHQQGLASVWTGTILVAPFVVDATYTLLVRFITKQKVMSAHRLHLYQILVNEKSYKASTVSLFYLGLNIFLFFPMAFILKDFNSFIQVAGFILSSLPMVFIAYKMKAGILR